MTDSIDRVSATKETERRNSRSGLISGGKPKRRANGAMGDSVDISEEARDRASSGKG